MSTALKFDVLKTCLNNLSPEFYRKKSGTTSKKAITVFLNEHLHVEHNYSILEDLYELFEGEMPDGEKLDVDLCIIPPGFIISLEYMAKLLELSDYDFEMKGMVPFMTFEFDSYLCVSLQELVNKGYEAPVYVCGGPYQILMPDYCMAYKSVTAYLATVVECFEKGAFFIDNEGRIDYHFELWGKINKNRNGDMLYWITAENSPI